MRKTCELVRGKITQTVICDQKKSIYVLPIFFLPTEDDTYTVTNIRLVKCDILELYKYNNNIHCCYCMTPYLAWMHYDLLRRVCTRFQLPWRWRRNREATDQSCLVTSWSLLPHSDNNTAPINRNREDTTAAAEKQLQNCVTKYSRARTQTRRKSSLIQLNATATSARTRLCVRTTAAAVTARVHRPVSPDQLETPGYRTREAIGCSC